MKKLVLALVALAVVAAVATPAVADYNFYGSVRLATFYKYDDNANANKETAALKFATNSRFGAKATTGDLGGRVELGLYDGADAYLRLLYGTYKTDAGTLLIGQTYTPYFGQLSCVTNSDNFQHGYGSTYDGRQPQIRFDMTSGLYMAAIKNGQFGNADNFIPKLTVGFKNKAGALSYNVGVAYQTYTKAAVAAVAAAPFTLDPALGVVGNGNVATAAVAKRNVTSYLVYGDFGMKQDAMSAKVKVHYGQNLTEFGIKNRGTFDAVNNKNVTNYGAIAQVAMAGATVGASYTVNDLDGAKAGKDFTAFANYAFKPAKGFSITPEVAMISNNVNAMKFRFSSPDEVYGYVKWQMDF